jgi:hypothetical protein
MLGLVLQQIVGMRYRLRAHVRIDAAIRALESDLLVVFKQQPLIPVQYDRHVRSLLFGAKSHAYASMHHQAVAAARA